MSLRKLPLLAVCTVALLAVSYSIYYKHQRQDSLWRKNVEAIAEELTLPPIGRSVYQEGNANRNCKLAEIRKLFASNLSPHEICKTIYSSLDPKKWDTSSGCSLSFYPLKAEDVSPERYRFETAYLSVNGAKATNPNVFLRISVLPKNAWSQTHGMLRGLVGEHAAITKARNMGSSFFTVSVRIFEGDPSQKYCLEVKAGCECESDTTSWHSYADG